MKTRLKAALAAAIGLGSLGLGALSASAMPMGGLDPAMVTTADARPKVENVRWVCGPYGYCRWAPGYGHWGPHPWAGGWHRHYGWGGYGYRHYW
ncbi:MAG TPA: hypothetical protein VEQ35_10880 [Beijerinckia sp.]|nr:hypothetical protein [Beijerinckia sp.]